MTVQFISDENEEVVGIGETAKMMGVHIDTLRRWDSDGTFPSIKTSGNHRRYKLCDIKKFVLEKMVPFLAAQRKEDIIRCRRYVENQMERSGPHVFEIVKENDDYLLVKLVPSNSFFCLCIHLPKPKRKDDGDDDEYYKNLPKFFDIDREFEYPQPTCSIGTYNTALSRDDVINLFDKRHAAWSAETCTITRATDRIIKMDWGLRLFNCYV